MKEVIIIQARSTSKRFPGKIMQKIGNKPMIQHVYDNVCDCATTVVAVPTGDEVIPYLKDNHIPYFEGDEEDVLSRYYHCAKAYKADWIWRITSDCPLIDKAYLIYLNAVKGLDTQLAFTTGIDGQDVEGFSFGLLKKAFKQTKGNGDREHVTPWMRRYVKEQNISHIEHKIPFTAPKMSVDTPEDLERVRKIYEGTLEVK